MQALGFGQQRVVLAEVVAGGVGGVEVGLHRAVGSGGDFAPVELHAQGPHAEVLQLRDGGGARGGVQQLRVGLEEDGLAVRGRGGSGAGESAEKGEGKGGVGAGRGHAQERLAGHAQERPEGPADERFARVGERFGFGHSGCDTTARQRLRCV